MQISILGAAGFLGRKVAERLAKDGTLGSRKITGLTLFDLQAPAAPEAAFPVRTLGGDIAALPVAAIPPGTDAVFHLAAVVSAAAEADYELGRRVNLRGTDAVIDACRALSQSGAKAPRVVFTSSVASFGGGQKATLPDDARQMPTNSYGAQKAAAELMLNDASRRGFLDAVCIRLPTIVVRPGRPNKAASSFFSSILREPLLDETAFLPVPDGFKVWIASPRRAVDWLLHAAAMDTTEMGLDRGVNPPGLCVTVEDMLAALDRVRPGASARVERMPDPAVEAIVGGWPAAFQPARALHLGFSRHEDLDAVVQAFIDDDLAATAADRNVVSR